jgi:hypothetical protein
MRRHQQQQQQNAINLGKHVFVINLIYVSSHFEQIKLVCVQQQRTLNRRWSALSSSKTHCDREAGRRRDWRWQSCHPTHHQS